MTSRNRLGTFALAIATSALTITGHVEIAQAQDAAEKCSAAYEDAQRQRARGALIEATRQAQICSQAECNSLIVEECIRLYEQIQLDTPSVVLSARNGNGEELTEVRVQIDGQVVAERLEGRPIELNPGLHTFRFEAPGLPPLEVKQTARVGDRNRLLEIVLGDLRPTAPPPSPRPAETVSEAPPPPKKTGIPVASIVLGSVGVLGLGAFGYFRLSATSDYNEMGRTCSPRCNPDDTDKIHSKFQLSYVSLGVGAVGLGGAVLFYVLSRDKQGAPASQVGFAPTPYGGAQARWQTRF